MKRKRRSEEITKWSSSLLDEMVPNHQYDIFLSFRGSDTRQTFTAHLYERLTHVGFKVYKDEIEMEKGEYINNDLMKAISSSRVCIPIFSKDYASSKACLRELSHMLECKKRIIPIFYDVTPDDVKLKTGEYKDALLKHRGYVGLRDEIEKWEKALISVAEISGYNFEEKNEADEITSITQDLMKLMPRDQDMTKLLIDVDEQVEQVKSLLCLSNSDSYRIIGIHGLGGIGKTTLAKAIFNKIHSSFEGCSFLENVREKMQNGRHVELQQQLYADTIDHKLSNHITSRNDGIKKLEHGLKNKKILLVLDDVKCAEQLEELFGNEIWFAKGSRIIITTRDRDILDGLKSTYKEISYYEVEEMKDDQALKLFCRSAFQKDFPCVGYESLSEKAISYTGGLPLAIKVIGSLLSRCTEKDVWERTLEEQRSCLEDKIKMTMMISYKALNRHQQGIFLDIANYPGDLHKEYASYMWEDCKWNPDRSIPVLDNHSLVNIIYKDKYKRSKGEYLRMHDVLKDFGRDLVRAKSEKHCALPSRLHINGKLDNLHGIKACVETMSISNATITSEDMIGLCQLKFLELSDCTVMGNFEVSFPNLRWLSLNFPWDSTNLYWDDQVAITNLDREVWGTITDLDREVWGTIKADKLKVLSLKFYGWNMLEVPFKKFSSLKILILVGFQVLTNEIVASFIELTSLCKLEISDTYIIELPDSIGLLKQLKELRVYNCFSLERVPELPLNLTLLYLHFERYRIQLDWSSQFKLTNIIELEICSQYEDPLRVDELSFEGIKSVELSIEWIKSAANLKKLCLLLPCYIITSLEKVDELSRLEHLNISHVRFQYLQHLPSSLLHLELSHCEFLNGVLDMSNSKDLEYLGVYWEEGRLVEIKGLGKSLHTLELNRCCKLKSIHVLGALNELESLTLRGYMSVECVLDLSKSRKLKRLELNECRKLRNIEGLAGLESLKHVKIIWCRSLELSDADLSKLENAQNMAIYIYGCDKLPNIDHHVKPSLTCLEWN